jgi:hypothetical protein
MTSEFITESRYTSKNKFICICGTAFPSLLVLPDSQEPSIALPGEHPPKKIKNKNFELLLIYS